MAQIADEAAGKNTSSLRWRLRAGPRSAVQRAAAVMDWGAWVLSSPQHFCGQVDSTGKQQLYSSGACVKVLLLSLYPLYPASSSAASWRQERR